MKFNCVRNKIDELTIQRDFLEGELGLLTKELDDAKLLLTHTEIILSELEAEDLDQDVLDDVRSTVPFWVQTREAMQDDVSTLGTGEELVSKDFYVRLIEGELEFVGYDISLYVSNDTPKGSAISVGGYAIGSRGLTIPRMPKDKIMFLNTFSDAVLANNNMRELMSNGRVGIWISYEDYVRTFDAGSINTITDCNKGIF